MKKINSVPQLPIRHCASGTRVIKNKNPAVETAGFLVFGMISIQLQI